MIESSIEIIDEGLASLGAAFDRRIDERKRDLWRRLFVNYPAVQLSKAFKKIIDDGERFPVPKHFRQVLRELGDSKQVIGTPGKDRHGVACIYWSDDPRTPAYRAEDCPEGREFLRLFRKVAGPKALPREPGDEDLEAERNKQVQQASRDAWRGP